LPDSAHADVAFGEVVSERERGFAQTREYVDKAAGRSMYERAWDGVRLRG